MTTLILTPALFAELDAIARTEAGNALEVVPAEEMPNTAARVDPLMGAGYKDARVTTGVCMMDLSIIEIANRLNVDEIHGWPRPELDYSRIQPEDLYHFFLWHEIGHRLGDLRFWSHLAAVGEHLGTLTMVNEIRADRFAWRKLYPRQPLPLRPRAILRARQTAQEMADMGRLFPSRRARPKSLPTLPYLAVPASHVRKGIPWA